MRPTIRGHPNKRGARNLYPYFPINNTTHDHDNHDFKCVSCQDRRVKVHDIEFLMISSIGVRDILWGIWYPREFIEHGPPEWYIDRW